MIQPAVIEKDRMPEGIEATSYTIKVTATNLEDVNTILSAFKKAIAYFR
ncbi:hypothetical protein [Virgibacillus necropolis]|nr:hypothetical protein [Virgibacillus necropolis]